MDPCWFHVCNYDVIFKQVIELWRHKYYQHHWNTTNVMKIALLVRYFFRIHIRSNLRYNFGNHTYLERFKKILCISEIFGSRGGDIEILTMIDVQKCQFLAISEIWTIASAYCSRKIIFNNESLVCKHSLNFPLIIHTTKIVRFHIS